MRNSLRFAVVGAIAAASFAGSAQAATTATGNATAEVLSSLTVTSTADLLFGQIAANTGGTVTVNADATVASSGTLIATGSRSPAAFNVAGSPNAMVLVSLPTTPVNLTRSGGTETMSLGGFNTNPGGAFQLDGTGNGLFHVGGTLNVGNAQVAGAYAGSFQVSVEYQ
jgi:hypothetical protein